MLIKNGYVDDVLVIMPKETNVENKLRRLNTVDPNIQFTVEEEKDNKLPFLDTVIWRFDEGPKFSGARNLASTNAVQQI